MSKEKQLYATELAKGFACLADACPATCCGNWNVVVDDASYATMKQVKGGLGLRLRLATSYDRKNDVRTMCRSFRYCPMYRKHLCDLHKNELMEAMPKVCRVYPRRTVDYGSRVETSLELSCIYAAAKFLQNPVRDDMARVDTDYEVFWTQNNEDEAFLTFLIEDRERILSYWWESAPADYVRILRAIYEYTYAQYMWIVRDRLEEAKAITLPVQEPIKAEWKAPRIGLNRSELGLYPIRFLNELIYEFLTYPGLRIQTPKLYHLIKAYQKHFGKIYERDAEEYVKATYELMTMKQPELVQVLKGYYSHLMVQGFLEAYEDYYILDTVLLSSLHMEFLALFFIVEYLECGTVGSGRQAEILSAMEKGIRHKDTFSELILNRIRETYFAPR